MAAVISGDGGGDENEQQNEKIRPHRHEKETEKVDDRTMLYGWRILLAKDLFRRGDEHNQVSPQEARNECVSSAFALNCPLRSRLKQRFEICQFCFIFVSCSWIGTTILVP